MKLRLAFFASGTGTNVLKLLEHARELNTIHPALVIVDQRSSPLPFILKEKFPELNVRVIPYPENAFAISKKDLHETLILTELKEFQIDWIFLAGYMRMIGPKILNEYSHEGRSRIVNIHPSLLPNYPGLQAYERAFSDEVAFSGVTVHLVDSGMDTGEILAQEKFPRLADDTLESFNRRGQELEWKLYPQILRNLSEQKSL